MTDQGSVERIVDHVSGGENLPTDLMARLGAATKQLEEATEVYSKDKNENAAKARDEAAMELQGIKEQVDKQRDEAEAARTIEIDKLLADARNTREPSKAWMIGNGSADYGGYKAGDFLYNIMVRGDKDSTIAEKSAAEQALAEMGAVRRSSAAGASLGQGRLEAKGGYEPPAKATLGTASTTGGILIPGATISDLVKPPQAATAVAGLVRTINVNAYQTTIPVRVTAPTRAAVVAWGVTKTNVDLTYGGYTATAYTLAIIYDVAKQLLRYSGGAVEADLRGELETSFALGKAYYILQGSGTNEPYGIQTAIGTAFGAYTSSFTAGVALADSVAAGISTAAGALAVRNWQPEAALLGVAAYWQMLRQGTDEAGFFFAPSGGPTQIRPGTLISPWGIPVYAETQLAGTNDLLVGQFSAVQVFQGETFRVDTSDEAGDRWDKNLVGFRGENELGLDARAAVFAGAFQFIAAVI